MNSLELFEKSKSLIQIGDLVFFDGSDFSDLVECAEHFVSNSIEIISRGHWSHVGMIFTENTIIESTTLTNKNGPQLNSLSERIANYDGKSIYLFPLKATVRTKLDLAKGLAYGLNKVGKDHYSYKTIADFVFRPILGWVPFLKKQLNKPDKDSEVCSEFIVQILKVSSLGIPDIDSLIPNKTDPVDLSKVPLYDKPIPLMLRI